MPGAPGAPGGVAAPGERRIRADALRNEDAILDAAKAIFTTRGVDAPVRDIAAKAGIGMGTLYRRFPTRADLVAGVFRREVDGCAAEAATLTTRHPPAEALMRWLSLYTQFLTTKKGLAAALHSGDPTFDGLPDYFRSMFEPALASLLRGAAHAGAVRGDVEAYDLLTGIARLSATSGDDDAKRGERMVALLIDGLRCRDDDQPAR